MYRVPAIYKCLTQKHSLQGIYMYVRFTDVNSSCRKVEEIAMVT